MKDIHHVCVFCGSRKGNNPKHTTFACTLGTKLAENDIGLVFGGGSVGLMNEVANAVIEQGGHTHGVIPGHLHRRERTHRGVTRMDVTDTMHERKAKMSSLCDAYITLPGGFGTFEELLEVITWSQLGLHNKPVIIANVDGYFDGLIKFFDHAVETDFITPSNRTLIKTAETVAQCIEHLRQHSLQNY